MKGYWQLVESNTENRQIWDLGNKRFGAVPKIEETQNLELPDASNSNGTKKFSKDLVQE